MGPYWWNTYRLSPAATAGSFSLSALIFAAALIAASLLPGCGGDDGLAPDIETRREEVPGFDFVLPCPLAGFSQEYLFASTVARDGIPPIDHPSFSPAASADWMADDDRVLGVVVDGQAMALPIRIMVWHEVVNITGGTGKISVTYCPLTFTGIAFDIAAFTAGELQSLGVSGLLYNSNLVLYDRGSESFWPQMSASAYGGPMAGECLSSYPVLDTTWRFWKMLHPSTRILDRPGKSGTWGKYNLNPYEDYWLTGDILYPLAPIDVRLSPKTWVLGVLTDTGARVYPVLNRPLVNDSLPGVPFVVFNHNSERTMAAYKAWIVDGERLRFSFVERVDGLPVYSDDRTGSLWDFTGRCFEGVLAGSALEPMPSFLGFYFAWRAYFPGTSVYTGE